MLSSPIRILAINDFGFMEVKLQSAFSHPPDDRFAQVFGFPLRSAMHDGIISIPLKGDAWVLARHPRIEAVVQEKVCQQGRSYSSLRRSLFSRRQLSLLVLGRSFEPPFHIEHHPFLWGMLANSTHQEPMGDVVEEAFDIQIKHPVIFPASFSRLPHGVMRRFERSISVAIQMKERLPPPFQKHLFHHFGASSSR